MEIISRSEAKVRGMSRFFTGKPCVHGHLADRRVSNGGCSQCHRERIHAKVLTNLPLRAKRRHAYYIKNKARHAELGKQWLADHPLAKRARWSRRRGLEAKTEGSHTAADIKRLYDEQGGRCLCGADLALGYHVDHKVPLSRKGTSWASNLQLLCPPCNDSKGTRTMQEWEPNGY